MIKRYGIDPKLTEEFLMSQEDVVDASAWIDRGELHAHVTRGIDSAMGETEFISLCLAEIGERQTPVRIRLVGRMPNLRG